MRPNKHLHTLILAAGQGKRMKSRHIKLLHEVAGRPIVSWVLEAVRGVHSAGNFIVLGHQIERVQAIVEGSQASTPDVKSRRTVSRSKRSNGAPFHVLEQREQRGTGHAVMQAERPLRGARGDLLVLNGDMPAIRASTLQAFVSNHVKSGASASLLTTTLENPTGYGRILRDGLGEFAGIVEERDATAEERRIRDVSVGIYCFDIPQLFRALRRTRPDNAQGEFYLPDVLGILKAEGRKVVTVRHDEPWEVLGINSRAELARVSQLINRRIVESWMDRGVTILEPERTFIGPDVKIGRDTILYPGLHLGGKTTIGNDCVLHPGCFLQDSRVEHGAVLLPYCVASEARIGPRSKVGPFAHLRPGSDLGPDVHIGNFVELKKTRLGAGTKANHLSYLGDAEIGPGCNIGAGTITCNYDGVRKHKTLIDRDVFVGSDSQLVAPVRVRRGAYIGSGSTIVEDVPPGALALSRARQIVIKGWVARRKREMESTKTVARTTRSAAKAAAKIPRSATKISRSAAKAARSPRPSARRGR